MFHITESLNVEYGGQSAACAQLTGHLASAGAAVWLATIESAPGRAVPLDPRVESIACPPTGPAYFRFSTGLARRLEAAAPSLVHVHGLWRLYLRQAANFAGRTRVPMIVSTHGMLHGPALRQRGFMKSMVRWLGQDRLLSQAACLHATAEAEALEIRSLGLTAPVAVIPWGVDLPLDAPRRAPKDERVVLFLGRYHPTKGLDTLLRAWARTAARYSGARLRMAGYDDGGYRARCEALAQSLGVGASVLFEGPVEGEARERLFAAADVLVLPSPSENFGLVVPEALARGVPVIATEGTPWASLAAQECGWWVAPDEHALADALNEALSVPRQTLSDMGERGVRYARSAFAWDRVAASMLALYNWALGRSPIPSFVQTS